VLLTKKQNTDLQDKVMSKQNVVSKQHAAPDFWAELQYNI